MPCKGIKPLHRTKYLRKRKPLSTQQATPCLNRDKTYVCRELSHKSAFAEIFGSVLRLRGGVKIPSPSLKPIIMHPPQRHFPPDFYRQIKHNKLRRALWHDYHSRCFYLLTFSKLIDPAVPLFSSLTNKGNSIGVDFSWSGRAIYNAISLFSAQFPFIKIRRYVIMPDHLHLILNVTERTEMHLGQYVKIFKILCTQRFHSKAKVHAETDKSIFEPGFNDRILTKESQLDIWTNYVSDNPRRLWLMRHNPNFFQRSHLFTCYCPEYVINENADPQSSVLISHKFPLFGNLCLLNYPEKINVRFSRKYTRQEWEEHQNTVRRVAKNAGILVSPFIHSEEKLLMEEGISLGARIIKIIPDGYSDRMKPSGDDFYHCAEGRMLFFALKEPTPDLKKTPISRPLCQRMNECAKWLISR